MISDVLSNAVVDIRRYLHSPITGKLYAAQRPHIERVLIEMEELRIMLDTLPVICDREGNQPGD